MEPLKLPIQYDPEKLKAFCEKWQIVELSFFGSILREDFGPDSDIDLLVSFKPGTEYTILWDNIPMADDLENIFHRKIDLVSKDAVVNSRNKYRRGEILNNARVAYVGA